MPDTTTKISGARMAGRYPAMSRLFARKPISQLQPPADDARSLKRVLGAGDLVMLAIGAVIGAGIFGAIGTAAAGQLAFCLRQGFGGPAIGD